MTDYEKGYQFALDGALKNGFEYAFGLQKQVDAAMPNLTEYQRGMHAGLYRYQIVAHVTLNADSGEVKSSEVRKTRSIRMTDEEYETFIKVGEGNAAAGVRKLVAPYMDKETSPEQQKPPSKGLDDLF